MLPGKEFESSLELESEGLELGSNFLYRHFVERLDWNRWVLFTKFDEAAHVGIVLNVLKKVNKALSYVTTGQNVPDDIEVGEGRRLAARLLGRKA